MNLGHYDTHPAYRPQAMTVMKGVNVGQTTNMPVFEAEAGRGVPWFGPSVIEFDDDRGVNAVAVFFEFLTDDVTFLGAPESFLYQPSFEALKTDIDDFRISPLITNQSDATALIAQLFTYCDMWCRPSAANGWKLEVGRWVHGNIDISALPVVGSDDLTSDPDLTGNGYADTVNLVRVQFADREHYFHDALSEPYVDANNFRVVGEVRAVQLSMPWITDAALANRYAAEYGKMNSQPLITGTITVKRERVDALGLWPGQLFKLDFAADGFEYVMRIIDLEWPASAKGECTLTIENERGIWPSLFIPPPAPRPGNFIVEAVAIAHQRIVELPSALKDKNAIQVAVLAQRPSDKIVRFAVHVSADDATTFDLVAPRNDFAAYGRVVNADYAAAGPILDTATGIQVELFGVDNIASQTDSQRDDRNLLLFVGGEIMSVGQVTPLGAGKYKIYVHRSLYGSAQGTHVIGDDCFFVLRENINPIDNKVFIPGATAHFKLQPYTDTQEYDLSLVASVAHTFASGPFLLSGLELFGQGNNLVFTGRDPRFAWRLSTTGGIEISGSQLSLGAFDDQFAQFNLRVRDVGSGAVVWTGSAKTTEYVFDFEQNARCAGGPRNHFLFAVAALTRAIDGSPEQTPWEEIEVSNTLPTNPGGSVTARYDRLDIALNPVADLDYAGIIVLRHRTDPNFQVNDAGVEIAFLGPGPNFSIPQPEATTWYYRSANFDAFTDPATWPGTTAALYTLLFGSGLGPAVPFTTLTLTPTIPPPPISAGSTSFTTPFDVSVAPPSGMKVVYAFDRVTLRNSPEWPGGIGSYGVINISRSCALHWRGIDAAGILTQEGIANFVLVASGSGGTPTCAGVSVHKNSGTLGLSTVNISLACSQPSSTIHFQLNGGGLTTYSGPFNLNVGDSITFYATASGFNDSPTDYFENPAL